MLSAKKYRHIIFHIQDEKTIVIESTGGRDSTYDEYLEKLPDDACRYGLYDLEFQHSAQGGEDSLRKILFLMSWSPEDCKIREKMLYSSSFRPLEKALQGVRARIEVTDKSEAAQEAVLEKMKLFLKCIFKASSCNFCLYCFLVFHTKQVKVIQAN